MSWQPLSQPNPNALPYGAYGAESYKKLDGAPDYGSIPPYGAAPPQGAYPAGQPPHPGSYQTMPVPGMYPGGQPITPGVNPQAQFAPPPYPSVANAPPSPGVPFNEHAQPPEGDMPAPSAPPPPQMDHVAGYEGIGFTTGDFLAPPSLYMSSAPSAPPSERPEISSGPVWTDEEVREALLEYVGQFCCYGSGTANNMTITDKMGTSAYHYVLETFGESRQVNWAFTPYTYGSFIDGPEQGRAPGPWENAVQVPEFFKDLTTKLEIPHTSYVRPCHTCTATGKVICRTCYGMGRQRCSHCHGRGHRNVGTDRRRCVFCHGHGTRICTKCNGLCFVVCPSCQGTCNLRYYIELTIQWKNHSEDFIYKENSLPSDLIKQGSGTTAFQETHLRVWPINHFVIPEVNRASNDLVSKHGQSFPCERILQQRQTIRVVPVVEVNYSWKDKQSDFFVYGLEKKIHAPKYPQTCCCGCTIL